MKPLLLLAFPLVASLAALGASAQPAGGTGVRDDVVVRVPVRPPPPLRIVWQPGRAVKCLQMGAIRGATLSSPEHVDILLPRQQRVRAHFAENCPALDFYGGFYLRPQDGRLCAGRDIVYSRMGGSCRVEGLRLLVPRVRVPKARAALP